PPRQADAVARRIRSGTVMVNDVLQAYAMPETPWAGVKSSGLGRVHSEHALRDMSQTHHVNGPSLPALSRDPWWYPYSQGLYRMIRWGARLLWGRGLGRVRVPPRAEPLPIDRVLPRGVEAVVPDA
ncbi:MAG: aldehyde dehydrogenase family protein, partial [Myxococcota bacterium]|nr:aldehyde dehydrogenase family protein [Myxococcota bacterium]